MRSTSCIFLVFVLALACLAIVGCEGVDAHPPAVAADSVRGHQQLPFTETKPLTVPANTLIYVRMLQPLSSASARTGQHFSATLDEPLMIEDQVAAPRGSEISGKVVAARESGRLHNAGYLRITLT